MTDEERIALEQVQFDWAIAPEDVWSPVVHHVRELHTRTAKILLGAVPRSTGSAASPLGVVLQGERGVGKTHLLRWLRQQVQEDGGYFFLVKPLQGGDFWRSAVHAIVDGFDAGPTDQLALLLTRLCDLAGLATEQRARILGTIPITRDALDGLVVGIRDVDRQVARDCQNTVRALVLSRARNADTGEIGYSYLAGDGDVDDLAAGVWGFRSGARSRQLVLRDLSRLLALTGPTVVAVDQIDTLIQHLTTTLSGGADAPVEVRSTIGGIANGLMELRELTRRTLTVVACLPASWDLITRNAVNSAADRFRVQTLQGSMPNAGVAADVVAQHLGAGYDEIGFVPPYPTWPVLRSAFDGQMVRTSTPRRLMQAVDQHVRACLDAGEVRELADFAAPVPMSNPGGTDPSALADLDARFAALRVAADITAALDPDAEDARMPALLLAGLRAYVAEVGERGQAFSVDHVRGRRPALHARLRETLDEGTEDEVHYTFRAIAHGNARAVQSRLAAARTESGLDAGSDRRKLVLLRNRDWPGGRVTAGAVEEFEKLGGTAVPIGESDLRTFAALEALQRPPQPGWLDWLQARRPASRAELFARFLPGPSDERSGERPIRSEPVQVGTAVTDQPSPHPREPSVPVGRAERDERDIVIPLAALRQHAAVFAGSGSGKTVLLRRLVEECALQGVSTIVLDPNNDLCRLGDPWPEPPDGWFDGDDAKATTYLADTEVVVWTPGRKKGRPLSFRPLPDFGPVLGDEDEFRAAIDSTVASLAPRVGLTGKRLEQGKAVLHECLEQYARDGDTTLDGLIDLLAELPDGISGLKQGPRLAAEMSEQLHAARINDPLFGGSGTPVDPSVLLTPTAGRRARVSVISFIGLPDDRQRQSFVNQLQMALFSWVKANPAGDRPLGGLLVMDEAQTFAPSGALTPCTSSTIALASQARKYGLGLVFATQAPKGLHNRIIGNAATQFFGFLNASAQINTAKELARAKGGAVDDISRLGRGEFYVAATGAAFERVREPMCLSHHPPSPPTAEEVIARAVGK